MYKHCISKNSINRVRSVRRTSLREKQMAAKADARGEARFRETFDSVVDDELQVWTLLLFINTDKGEMDIYIYIFSPVFYTFLCGNKKQIPLQDKNLKNSKWGNLIRINLFL